jgi:hypothetical protein
MSLFNQSPEGARRRSQDRKRCSRLPLPWTTVFAITCILPPIDRSVGGPGAGVGLLAVDGLAPVRANGQGIIWKRFQMMLQ